MSKKLAVMILHGMGNHGDKPPADSSNPTYSKKLHKSVRKKIGRSLFDESIAWREVSYSHVTEKNQAEYIKRVSRKGLRYKKLRSLVIKNLGDVAAYRPAAAGDNNTNIYKEIHKQIAKTVVELRRDTSKSAPLVILAHSLGGHVISNYIYDIQVGNLVLPEMKSMNTVASLVTFGCNIPIFTFGYAAKHIKAIRDPSSGLSPQLRQKTWWKNYYDRDDVLGYPLAQTGKGYEQLAASGQLRDVKIDAGSIFTSFTPFSHTQYWGDVDLIDPVSALLKKLANAA